MTEEGKFAAILAVRKLIEMEPDKPNMAKGDIVDRPIDDAAFILERIDKRWPFAALRKGLYEPNARPDVTNFTVQDSR
jgi:hypothetical protein